METIIIADKGCLEKAGEIAGLLDNITFLKDGVHIGRFRNNEIEVKLNGDFKGKTAILFKSFDNPNDGMMELFLVNDALKNAGADKIINILPFIPYLRQDRAKFPGDPVSSELMGKFLEMSGCDTIITLDMHSTANKEHFKNVIEISGASVFSTHLKDKIGDNHTIVSPDKGGEKRADILAEKIGLPVKTIKKERDEKGRISRCSDNIDCSGCAVMYDDIVDGGSTIMSAAEILKKNGCKEIVVCCSHPVLGGTIDEKKERLKKFEEAGIKLIACDSIDVPKAKNLEILSLSKTIADELRKIL